MLKHLAQYKGFEGPSPLLGDIGEGGKGHFPAASNKSKGGIFLRGQRYRPGVKIRYIVFSLKKKEDKKKGRDTAPARLTPIGVYLKVFQ